MLPVFVIIFLIFALTPNTGVSALNPGDVDVILYHHYDGIATPVQETKQLEAGDYALSALFTLTTNSANYKAYEITGASGGGELVTFEEGYIYTVHIYYARVYTVTFDGNGGTVLPANATRTVSAGGTLGADMPPSPSRGGYIFTGWNTAANGSGTPFTASTQVTGDITVYAQWTQNTGPSVTYTVSYTPGDHGNFTAVTHTNLVFGASTPAPPATPGQSGWTFNGWSPTPNLTVTGSVTYVAQWRQVTDPPTPGDKEGSPTTEPPTTPDPDDNIDITDPDSPLGGGTPETGDAGISNWYFVLLGIPLVGFCIVLKTKTAYKPRYLK